MIYFIRHAQSRFNVVCRQIEKKLGPGYQSQQEYLDQKFSSKYFDAQITPQGQQQALAAKQKVANLDFDLILVSPLRRALHTCSIIFQHHKSKAPIIVVPDFREIMESSNDLGTELQASLLRYPDFDFSSIKDKQTWYIDTLFEEEDRKSITQKLQGLQGEQKSVRCIQHILQLMKQNWGERRAHPQNQHILIQRILPNATRQKQILKHHLKTHPRIAVVSHSECIKPYAGYKIANCEIYAYQASKL